MDRIDAGEHREVTRRLFTVASLRIEAMGEAAGAGQASDLTAGRITSFASELITGGQELVALGHAIELLAEAL